MRGQKPLPEGSKEKLALALKSARTKGQYQLVLCLWLRAALGMNPRQIAVAVGMSPSSVARIWTRYFREGEAMFRKRGKGGRHHEYFSLPAERKFLDRLLLQTMPGQRLMDSRFIQEAYERTVGQPVSISAIHRMLKRNHWRTVDSSQIMMPLGWGPAAHPLSDDAPPYDGSLAS